MSQAKSRADTNALIRLLRSLCGLTQEQFAAKLGVTLVTVNRWENYRAKSMPLALRQLKALLIEISQCEVEANLCDRLPFARGVLSELMPKSRSLSDIRI